MNSEIRNQLFRKFIQNECTQEEVAQLMEWIAEDKDFDLPDLEEIKKASKYTISDSEKDFIYQSIISKAKTRKKKVFPKRNYLFYAAAVFIGILVTSVFYNQFNEEANDVNNSQKFVRLNISGDYQTLKDSDTIFLKNSKGRVVGKQINNAIVYNNDQAEKEEPEINTLEVPYGKQFELVLSDGTAITLNSGSSISYPEFFTDSGKRRISLTGEAYFDVAHNATSPFVVEADSLNIEVLGTSFNVAAYKEDETTEVVLVEGSVGLYEQNGFLEKENILTPGFKGSYNKKKGSFSKKEVETSLYTSWVSGRIIFRNMTFGNILKKLERKFDYTIEIQNKELMKERFNANFGDHSLPDILESLHKVYGINYEIKNKEVIIK